VLKAVENVDKILGPAVIGMDPTDQNAVDKVMLDIDGTPNKNNMGANAILGISLAVSKVRFYVWKLKIILMLFYAI